MKRSIETRSFPNLLVATLATLPSTSLPHQLRSRRDNGQRYRAELEHGIGMVTTALPFKGGKSDTFKS